MKHIYLPLVICTVLLTSCSDGDNTDSADLTSPDRDKPANVTKSEDGTVALAPTATADLQGLLDDFISCRDASTSRKDCRHWISKLVCEFNGIDDFKDGDSYVMYDSIRPRIERTSDWTNLGSGNDASVLELAQTNANNGLAVLAIDVSQSYGMVVLVLPGEGEKASKWGGNVVPNAACFTHVKALKPFINKSAAYAFRTPENIVFYSRKF